MTHTGTTILSAWMCGPHMHYYSVCLNVWPTQALLYKLRTTQALLFYCLLSVNVHPSTSIQLFYAHNNVCSQVWSRKFKHDTCVVDEWSSVEEFKHIMSLIFPSLALVVSPFWLQTFAWRQTLREAVKYHQYVKKPCKFVEDIDFITRLERTWLK